MTDFCKVCQKTNKSKKLAASSAASSSSSQYSPVCSACMKFFRRFSLRLSRTTLSSTKNRLLTCSCFSPSKIAAAAASSNKQDISGNRTCRACRYELCCQSGLFDTSDETKKCPVDFRSIKCPVCARPSTGFHFGAICCRGCKTFFARSNRRHTYKSYSCERKNTAMSGASSEMKFPCYSGQLIADPSYKSSCKLCRFEKCLSVGMSTASCKIGRHSHRFRAKLRAGSIDSTVTSSEGRPSITSTITDARASTVSTTIEEKPEETFVTSANNAYDAVAISHTSTSGSSPRDIVVAQMKSPISLSSKIWLYTSSEQQFLQFDFDSLSTLVVEQPHLQQDQFEYLHRYLIANPAQVSLAQQLSLPEMTRSEWLLARLVHSTRVLNNIREIVSPTFDPGMQMSDIFSTVIVHYYLKSIKIMLQFVKTLPGYDMLSVEDRTVLFTESFFQILAATVSLNYDDNTERFPKFFGLAYDESVQLMLRNTFSFVENAENFLTGIGRSIKQANLSIVEFSVTAALTFFNSNLPGLKDANTVETVKNEYLRAREMFIRQQCNVDAFSPSYLLRLDVLCQLENSLHRFRDFAFLETLALVEKFPELALSNPVINEVAQLIKQRFHDDEKTTVPFTQMMTTEDL